jgi:hypothetical protein
LIIIALDPCPQAPGNPGAATGGVDEAAAAIGAASAAEAPTRGVAVEGIEMAFNNDCAGGGSRQA